ncbi:MAG: NADH-quinone oxidoreductase subunit C [Rhodospirillales bacterium]|jgi:NADH-quinone oxidoreductase subunit C|nr:NADH-quinone oxidoreductase subunit C [Rhodospirillales bacterium]MBT4007594.1 NADH-quinone oxidoreductase subunit C [Rhodospirillales bacterium]MBT5076342.1 NADH-quinone oxidoreductase subunit C [Rhodospirillales bacterium]MBT5112701.1 NADH-quinone oxidoreductase subunit C [Rhodospirillales bacterium]MBT5673471.1 NADH-quinone oxidoreductase subunit C [Rhodospirillales bacterium]
MNQDAQQLEALKELGEYIEDILAGDIESVAVAYGELTVTIRDSAAIVKVLTTLRDDTNCQLHQLMDVCGVDYPEREKRFDVVYHLLSLRQNHRVRVRARVDENTPIPSVTGVFSAAGWWEREAWDMYGILFSGHPDLRRLLTDYGFEGHPLRKDFPLSGYVEVRYDDDQKRVVYEPVKLTQEFRNFDFLSPWEGAQSVRDAEEKEQKEEEKGEGTDG